MKFTLSLLVIFLSFQATANSEATQDPNNKWACVAYGYDLNNNYRGVPGEFAPTKKQAKQSALSECVQFGYSGCQIKSCYQYSSGN